MREASAIGAPGSTDKFSFCKPFLFDTGGNHFGELCDMPGIKLSSSTVKKSRMPGSVVSLSFPVTTLGLVLGSPPKVSLRSS